MSPIHVLMPIIALAFAVETAVGFGGMVITLAFGTLLLPIDEILPRVVPLNVGLSFVLAYRHGKHADGRYLLRRLLPNVLLGMPIGLAAFAYLDRRMLTLAFGVFVIALAVLELLARNDVRAPVRPLARYALLLAAGVMQGAFSTGGPMVVYVTAREVAPKARFRATLVLAWVVFGIVLLATYVVSGRTNAHTLGDSLLLVLPLVLGLLVGEQVHARIDEALFTRLVYGLLLCAGVALAARSLFS